MAHLYDIFFDDWLEESKLKLHNDKSKPFIGDRSYRHIDARISLTSIESNISFKLIKKLRDPEALESHAFLPFVRLDSKLRRYTNEYSLDVDGHRIKQVNISQKIRPIMFASHQDAVIFNFYGFMLKSIHNQLAIEYGIEKSVIAYRKIGREDGSGKNKSNIEFANEVFKFVQNMNDGAVLCLDLKNFFGNINHARLYEVWCSLLLVDKLPAGHNAVFKNITRYRYVFSDEIKAALGLGSIIKGKFRYKIGAPTTGSFVKDMRQFYKVAKNSGLIRINRTNKGIPQGSPISDILANMFMLDFDRSISEHLSSFHGTLYRRYSDDIFLACGTQNVSDMYQHVKNLLNSYGLELNEHKTEIFAVNSSRQSLVDITAQEVGGYFMNKKTIQYLGFEFDLTHIHVRSATIAKYYRKYLQSKHRNQAKVLSSQNLDKTVNASTITNRTNKRNKNAYLYQVLRRTTSSRVVLQFKHVQKRIARLRRSGKN